MKAIHWDANAALDPHAQHVPFRSPGRPRRKWDDFLKDFAREEFANECWGHVAADTQQWLAKEQSYVSFIQSKLYGS